MNLESLSPIAIFFRKNQNLQSDRKKRHFSWNIRVIIKGHDIMPGEDKRWKKKHQRKKSSEIDFHLPMVLREGVFDGRVCVNISLKNFFTLRFWEFWGLLVWSPFSAANGKPGIHHHCLHHPPGSMGRASVPSSAHGSLLVLWPFPRSSPPFPIPVAWTASSCSCVVKLSYLLVRGSPRLVLPHCCFLFWKCDQFSAISCVLLMVLCFPCWSFSAAVRC